MKIGNLTLSNNVVCDFQCQRSHSVREEELGGEGSGSNRSRDSRDSLARATGMVDPGGGGTNCGGGGSGNCSVSSTEDSHKSRRRPSFLPTKAIASSATKLINHHLFGQSSSWSIHFPYLSISISVDYSYSFLAFSTLVGMQLTCSFPKCAFQSG